MAIKLCNLLWRLLLGFVFLTAAFSKWHAGVPFGEAHTIYDRWVGFSPLRHYAILAAEVALGAWLISGWRPRVSAAISGLLLLGFTGLILWELRLTNPDKCGCGLEEVFPDGSNPRFALKMSAVRNVVLALGCLWLWLMSPSPEMRGFARSQTPATPPG